MNMFKNFVCFADFVNNWMINNIYTLMEYNRKPPTDHLVAEVSLKY